MARAAVVLVLSLALSCVDAFTPAAFAPRLAAAESRRASSGVGRGRWRRLRLASTVAEEATELAGDLASGDSSMWEAGAESYVLSTVERARTVAAACASGTLSTACQAQEGFPFGSHVDFILDEHGWPVLLLNEGALHTKNVLADQRASLFAHLPSLASGQAPAAMARVTVMGSIVTVEDQDELFALRAAYSVVHAYSTKLVESDRFTFMKLKPERIFYAGGFGVAATWVDVEAYETAVADPLALESLALVNKLNRESVADLRTLCTQFVPGLEHATAESDLNVKVTTIDRLGMDIRVETKGGSRTDEYRVGFMVKVMTMEDCKSEVVKIFQEAWEKEQGEEWEDMGPPIVKTSVDIIR